MDYSRLVGLHMVFFLATKDETSGILKSFITGIENLVDHKVKVIRCDNGTEFKNREMNQFCEMKGILRQFSVARTPQQNGVAERRNRTLIEAARTMLADSKLPTTFWAEAVNTACYVQNRVLVVKPHNKTPYELFHGRTPTLSFMRPFRCLVTILNTIDHLGKFDGKADKGFFVGYSLNSKAFRVFNSRTRIVEENLHIRFNKSTPNVVGSGPDWLFDIDALTRTMNNKIIVVGAQSNGFAGSGPDWLFDIDALTRTMNYKIIVVGAQSNGFAGIKASDNAGQARKETEPVKNYILLPLCPADPPFSQDPKSSQDDGSQPSSDDEKKVNEDPRKDSESIDQEKDDNVNSTNNVNAASINEVNAIGGKISIELPDDPNMHALEDISIFNLSRDNENVGSEADMTNLDTTIQIKEEVCVCQPPRFEDPDFPDRVYKVKKHCMDYIKLLDFGDILLVQVYVDDIIFGSTKKELCIEFEKLMHEKFQMSSMGELTFFLRLQVKQKKDGIFINQDKYVGEILKKFRSMIGSLMYLTSSRPNIIFVVYACARYQVNPKVSHLYAVKRIFRYLKGQLKLGLWYLKDSPFDLVAYTDSDYAGASLDRKYTTGDCQFLGCRLIS
ncbi:ribonuclease H-like domain-containing protein [Tanacetum coccineum]